MTLLLPPVAEANVRETDGTPGEDRRQPGNGQHPPERFSLLRGCREVPEETKECRDSDTDHGATTTINVREDTGSLTLLGESGEGTRGAVDGRVTDGQDSNHDNNVHDAGENLDTGILNGNDERRCRGISTRRAAEKARLGVGNQQSDEGEGDDVEEEDTPEDLFDGGGQRLARVCGFGGSKTDQLSTGEGEGGGDEHAAKTLEAVVESTGVVPVSTANVVAVRPTANIEDDTENAVRMLATKTSLDENRSGMSYMKPMTATTLMIEKTNSASP